MNEQIAELRSLVPVIPVPAVQGKWMNIRVRPDFASGELINVGVAFLHEEAIHFQLIEDFAKAQRIYGETAEDELRFLLSVLRTSLSSGELSPPSPNVQLSDAKYAAGTSVDEVLTRLFSSSVSLVMPPAPRRDQSVGKQSPRNNSWVRSLVLSDVKERLGINAAQVLPQEPAWLVKDSGHQYVLDMPIRTDTRVASLISTAFFQKETIELNFLRACLDLITARTLPRVEKADLFIYHPSEDGFWPSLEKKRQSENVIDFYEWKLRRQKVITHTCGAKDAMTQAIIRFAH